MKYQKRLRDEVERVLPEWKGQFICYKGLKKQLNLIHPRSSRDRLCHPIEEKLQVQRDILNLHAEMVLLLHYSVLNFTGLVKLVKKHNKRTGTSFDFSSMPRVMQRPFFSTDLLYELMRQCETMLDGLFLSKQP
ncbi:hypothetical protein NC652_002085 [Populus alba x Populus x berolinensis]|nr:hypothetical protein NC652_002085 [Populus alba x Populus x berolinensis]